MSNKSKFKVDDIVTCINNENYCNKLITINKKYKILDKYKGSIRIKTDIIGITSYLPTIHFSNIRQIRKEKLKKLNKKL